MRIKSIINAKYLSEITDIVLELAEEKKIVARQNAKAKECNPSKEDLKALQVIWGMADIRATDLLEIRKLN